MNYPNDVVKLDYEQLFKSAVTGC